MVKTAQTVKSDLELRSRAENRIRQPDHDPAHWPKPDLATMVHELQVHQMELEMQNDELRRIQSDLEESRDAFARLYDLAPVGYLSLDEAGLIRAANLTVANQLNLSRKALVGKDFFHFLSFDSQDAFYHYKKLLLKTGLRQSCEVSLLMPNRDVLPVRLDGILVREEKNNGAQYFISVTDIREQLEAESARARLAAMVNSSNDAVISHSLEAGIIQSWNQGAEQLFGYSEEQMVGQCFSLLVLKGNLERSRLIGERIERGERVEHYETVYRKKNGGHFSASVSESLIKDSRGKILGISKIVRDVSRRIELEKEILDISEREQQRIGRDLHDDLGQQLAGIEFLAQSLATQLPEVSKPAALQTRAIAKMVRHAMVLTRELAHGLSPLSLESDGLMLALKALAARTKMIFKVNCQFICKQPVLIPNDVVGKHLYRIAQEAVTNAIKHGKAKRINIKLALNKNNLSLSIGDDGDGYTPPKQKQSGIGIRLMEYRAAVIGGTLEIRPQPKTGTIFICTLKMESLFARKSEN